MKNVSANDFFATVKVENFSSIDLSLLLNFYSPIIGGRAIATYQALFYEENSDKLKIHRSLFLKLQSNPGEFFQDIEALESVGLIQSYLKNEDGIKYFKYRLFSPLDASSFFDDLLLTTSLKRYVGDEMFSSLKRRYLEANIDEGYQNITSDFEEVSSIQNKEKKLSKIKSQFDNGKFFQALLPYQLNESSFSRKEIANLIKLSALYPIEEDNFAQIVAKYYRSNLPLGNRVDFEGLKNETKDAANFHFIAKKSVNKSASSSDSSLGELIRMMDTMNPVAYLSALQNQSKPVDSDLKIVESLSLNLGLSDGVINAIISYTLQKNNNILSKAYCEKLGASLAREGVNNARDAMDCLNRYSSLNKGKRYHQAPTPYFNKKNNNKAKEESEEKEEEVSIEEALEALSSLKEKQ